ncbi:MAG: aldehyde dehydrogenase family protein [Gammaproteobacteria bacterium]|nr:aldehyde dehydrogenase family protein [Gammaproteobacteria bacterium]
MSTSPLQNEIDSLRRLEIAPGRLLINGQWCDSEGHQTVTTVSPIDGVELTTLALASETDVDKCVVGARAVFERGDWSRASPGQRKRTLLKWAQLIEEHQTEIAVLGVRDNGTEIAMAHRAEPGSAATTLRYYAEAADKIYGAVAPTEPGRLGMVVREPVGVVGAIIPWNFPLMIGMWKVAPALACGNSVILKPPQNASLSWLRVAQLALDAGVPAGVFSVITGTGSCTGRALSRHGDVDIIAFTGGATVGRGLLKDAADTNIKRVYLELGGKSPHVVFADTRQFDASVQAAVKGIFRNAGQVCIAGSRLLVEEDIAADYLSAVVAQAEKLVVGDPLDLRTDVGAVCGDVQLQQDLQMAADAVADGATLCCGGRRVNEQSGGTYMEPTVYSNVSPDSRLAKEEVFGPVLAVMTFAGEDEAIRLANNTCYGLSAGLWTEDLSRAHRVAAAIQSGVVHVNCYGGAPVTMPLGGVKQSGNGYDKSPHALDKFVNLKSIWLHLTDA